MIVACLALLVALGGTSVAAVQQLGRNTVGTAQLRNNAVTTPKIRNIAVTAAKIRDNAVVRRKIANNAVTSAQVANGSLLATDFATGQIPEGPAGPAGPAGAAGPAGPAGPQGRWVHVAGNGSILAQSGGASVTRTSAGVYFVTFTGATVIDKPILATASRVSANYHAVTATACGGAPQGVVCATNNNTNTVLVNTLSPTLVSADLQDSSFYLMVVP